MSTGQGVIGCNMFCYCGNNPVNRSDESGNFWNIIIGAVVGTVVGAVSAAICGDNVWVGAAAGLVAGTISGLTLGMGSAIALAGGAANTMLGLGVAAAGGALGSATGEVIRQVGNNEQINGLRIAKEAVAGAVGNTIAFGIGSLLGASIPGKELVMNAKGHVAIFTTMAKNIVNQSVAETIVSFHFSMFQVSVIQFSTSLILNSIGVDK